MIIICVGSVVSPGIVLLDSSLCYLSPPGIRLRLGLGLGLGRGMGRGRGQGNDDMVVLILSGWMQIVVWLVVFMFDVGMNNLRCHNTTSHTCYQSPREYQVLEQLLLSTTLNITLSGADFNGGPPVCKIQRKLVAGSVPPSSRWYLCVLVLVMVECDNWGGVLSQWWAQFRS